MIGGVGSIEYAFWTLMDCDSEKYTPYDICDKIFNSTFIFSIEMKFAWQLYSYVLMYPYWYHNTVQRIFVKHYCCVT